MTTVYRSWCWGGARAELQRDDAAARCFWCRSILKPCSLGEACPGDSSTTISRSLCTRCTLQAACPRHGTDWYAL